MPRALVVTLCVVLFALLGYVGGTVTGKGGWQFAALGAVAGFAVALTAITGRRRWIAMAALVCLLLYLALFAGPAYAAAAALASLLTLVVSAGTLREFYEGSEMNAILHHLEVIFGIVHGFQVVDVEQVNTEKSIPIQFGPKHVLTKRGVATVFERGSRQTRVSGPALITTESYEYVSNAFDLRLSTDTIYGNSVLTLDRAQVQVHARYDYGLDLRPEAVRGEEPLNQEEIDRLQILNDMQRHTDLDLRQYTRSVVELGLRRAVSSIAIDDLIAPLGTELAEQRALQYARPKAAARGLAIPTLLIDEILPETEYGEVMQRAWAVGRENEVLLEAERARAIAMRDALRIIVDGYSYARQNNMSDEAIARWVLKQTIDTISKDPAAKVFLPSELQVSVNAIRSEL